MWMARKTLFVAGALLVLTAGAALGEYWPGSQFEDPNGAKYVEGELLVRFAPKADGRIPSRTERDAVLTALGGAKETGSYWLVPGLTVVRLPDGLSVEVALPLFNKRPEILYAEPNYLLYILFTPNDPRFDLQWGLHNTGQTEGTAGADVNAPEAWDLAMGTREIVVAVIDTGVDYQHPDLARNMWVNEGEIPGNGVDDDENRFIDDVYGYNMIGSEPNIDPCGVPDPCENASGDPMDDNGHGTHCAGIIGAVTNNSRGLAGVCPNVTIMALKFLHKSGGGLTKDAISCIQYAVNNGANIMSNSWGGGGYNQSLEAAIEAAAEAGLLFIAAAGNNNSNNDTKYCYPATYDCNNIIAVLATDHDDEKASFSNYGAKSVELGAPGDSIESAWNLARYASKRGTSMACPHVAGACALVWSVNPSLSGQDVNDVILDSVDKVDSLEDMCITEGRLNVHRAILKVPRSEGFVTLDRSHYSCSDQVGITVGDIDLSGNGSQDVNVVTSDGNDLETVTLTESPSNSGLFLGTITTRPNSVTSDSGYLEVLDDETITVTYRDANDGTGSSMDVNDTATADCTAPGISSVDVNSVCSIAARITLDTNEPAFARVSCASDVNGPFNIMGQGALMEKHLIEVRGLSAETIYYFKVDVLDLAGNASTDTNDANYYSLATASVMTVPDDHTSIQDAIDDANLWPLETILVEPSTYYEAIDFKGKAISVTGTNPQDWETVEGTVIDGSMDPARAVVTFRSEENRDSVLRGLTIRNSVCYGVYCKGPGRGPVVSNCIVENCADYGLMTIAGTSPLFSNNKVRNNHKGILLSAAPAYVENSWVHDNNDFGIRVVLGGGQISNCTVVGNSVGISAASALPSVTNCIVWSNDVNDVEGNTILTYSCISDCNELGDPNKHNICGDPCFVDIDANDLHLDANSTCIDAGDPNGDYAGQTDIDGNCRDVNGVDIGADEICLPSTYTTYTDWVDLGKPACWCQSYQCDGDADGSTEDPNNYRIYENDIHLIIANWKKKIDDETLDPCADIDHKDSGLPFKYRVYTNDLSIVTANWKKTDAQLGGDCPRSE